MYLVLGMLLNKHHGNNTWLDRAQHVEQKRTLQKSRLFLSYITFYSDLIQFLPNFQSIPFFSTIWIDEFVEI